MQRVMSNVMSACLPMERECPTAISLPAGSAIFPRKISSAESAAFWEKESVALLLLNWRPCMDGFQ